MFGYHWLISAALFKSKCYPNIFEYLLCFRTPKRRFCNGFIFTGNLSSCQHELFVRTGWQAAESAPAGLIHMVWLSSQWSELWATLMQLNTSACGGGIIWCSPDVCWVISMLRQDQSVSFMHSDFTRRVLQHCISLLSELHHYHVLPAT